MCTAAGAPNWILGPRTGQRHQQLEHREVQLLEVVDVQHFEADLRPALPDQPALYCSQVRVGLAVQRHRIRESVERVLLLLVGVARPLQRDRTRVSLQLQ